MSTSGHLLFYRRYVATLVVTRTVCEELRGAKKKTKYNKIKLGGIQLKLILPRFRDDNLLGNFNTARLHKDTIICSLCQ